MSQMKEPEAQDKTWNLLGKAPPPRASERFLSEIVEAARSLPQDGSPVVEGTGIPLGAATNATVVQGPTRWFQRTPAVRLLAAAAAVALLAIAAYQLITPDQEGGSPIAESPVQEAPVEGPAPNGGGSADREVTLAHASGVSEERPATPAAEPRAEVEQLDFAEEAEVIDTLGTLMAVSDPAMLPDEALAELLF